MQKLKSIFEELLVEFDIANIEMPTILNLTQDGYEIGYKGGSFTLSANNYVSAIKALQIINMGLKSGHIADFLGKTLAQTLLRPLLIQEDLLKQIYDEKKLHLFCKTIFQLGFNAVLLEENDDSEFINLCHALNSYQIKILLKPNAKKDYFSKSPLHRNFQNQIIDYIKKLSDMQLCYDYLFWESNWQHPEYSNDPKANELLFSEILFKEASLLEKILDPKKSLIFYIPTQDNFAAINSAPWIEKLREDLSIKTITAFNSVAGHFIKDHLPLHPYWNLERKKIIKGSSKIMSIVNMGAINYGSGLWPIVSADLIDNFYNCPKSIGIISTIGNISHLQGINNLNLFLAAQKLWSNLSTSTLIESWFQAYKPDWQYTKFSSVFKQIRALSKSTDHLKTTLLEKDKDYLSNQECRQICESINSQLNEIAIYLEKDEQKRVKRTDKPSFQDYFSFYSSDIKKTILYISQMQNVTVPNLFNENDQKDSFWVSLDTPVSQGMRSAARVTFLQKPAIGPNKRQQTIYQENCL